MARRHRHIHAPLIQSRNLFMDNLLVAAAILLAIMLFLALVVFISRILPEQSAVVLP